jgi:hypothetical protein
VRNAGSGHRDAADIGPPVDTSPQALDASAVSDSEVVAGGSVVGGSGWAAGWWALLQLL